MLRGQAGHDGAARRELIGPIEEIEELGVRAALGKQCYEQCVAEQRRRHFAFVGARKATADDGR